MTVQWTMECTAAICFGVKMATDNESSEEDVKNLVMRDVAKRLDEVGLSLSTMRFLEMRSEPVVDAENEAAVGE